MKDVIVIKIGGVAAQKLSDKFIKQMQEWIAAGKKIVVVHGGGLVINQLSASYLLARLRGCV